MALAPSRPTRAGQFKLRIDGSDAPDLTAGLIDCVIEHRPSAPASCVATFVNWGQTPAGPGYLHFGRKTLDFGKALAVVNGSATLFQGRIAALEGEFPEGAAPVIRVTAEDALAGLWERNGFQAFSGMSDADVVRRIAADHGLRTQLSLAGPRREVIVQAGESDLEFLRARLDAIGAFCWVDARGRLCAVREPGGRETPIALTLGRNLIGYRVRADVRGQSTTVRASGWDVAAKAPVSATADRTVVAGEIPSNETDGSTIRESAFGMSERLLADSTGQSAAEVDAAARFAFARRAREFLLGVAETNDVREAYPGRGMNIQGVGPLFSGLYRVETVTHRFDQTKGWRSDYGVRRASLGNP